MKVVYSAPLSSEQEKIVYSISKECGIMQDTARILVCRGIDTVDKAVRFLNPGKHNFNDPFLLNGMVDAVDSKSIVSNDIRVQVPWLVPIMMIKSELLNLDLYL